MISEIYNGNRDTFRDLTIENTELEMDEFNLSSSNLLPNFPYYLLV